MLVCRKVSLYLTGVTWTTTDRFRSGRLIRRDCFRSTRLLNRTDDYYTVPSAQYDTHTHTTVTLAINISQSSTVVVFVISVVEVVV